jgi:hypothetical protein
MEKLRMALRAILGIWRGNTIIIEDRGDKCNTFIGSSIDVNRFKVLMINQIKASTQTL